MTFMADPMWRRILVTSDEDEAFQHLQTQLDRAREHAPTHLGPDPAEDHPATPASPLTLWAGRRRGASSTTDAPTGQGWGATPTGGTAP